MPFQDMGRMALEATITDILGTAADDYDIETLVNGYVKMFGFVDIDTTDPVAFWNLVADHKRPG